MTHSPVVASFWDAPTGSWQYVLDDPDTMRGAMVDPVWNFDPLSGATAARDAQKILDYVQQAGITVDWILDTHPHADHFSAAVWLKDRLGAKTGIGEHVVKVQKLWKDIYNLGDDVVADGHQWDRLFRDGETLMVGSLPVQVMFSPGHTMASVTYIAGDAAFVHDTLMMPDSGTSRADFPGGSSSALYDSLQRILALPPRDAALCRARLCPGPSRRFHGDSGPAPRDQHPPGGRAGSGYVSCKARRPRCHVGVAQADACGLAGQHPGRSCAGP